MAKLTTERLILRRFRAEDGEDLYRYLSQETVVKYEPYGVFTREQSQTEAERRATDSAFWAVCLKEEGTLIGNLYFQQQQPERFGTWELGYVFNTEFQGQGYATEACRALLAYGFGELQIRRVIARCNPDNTSSWKLLERLSLRQEGHALQTVFFKTDSSGAPIWHDTFAYGMLASEWVPSSQLELQP
ncbi:GNAT family N-acetyltransferase [Paenibacillus donghaensis]|uniref:GNAT family N-acetyltransferase n=1 Tax=Paenibacillus donghaensis TaxID=414771 RepID=A0A2Z2KKP9_9BACL|nr:GNAT family N-acetyltransferase [Paenibacillus donghaensis]ASA20471.1 GNAT family N-acetyltransferase [Paenibacillus donghaensis]